MGAGGRRLGNYRCHSLRPGLPRGRRVHRRAQTRARRFEQFAKFGEIESVKAVSDLFIPLSGTVTEVNQEAVDDPELVNTDPYGGGWLIKLRIDDSAGLDNLLSAEAYEALLAESG